MTLNQLFSTNADVFPALFQDGTIRVVTDDSNLEVPYADRDVTAIELASDDEFITQSTTSVLLAAGYAISVVDASQEKAKVVFQTI